MQENIFLGTSEKGKHVVRFNCKWSTYRHRNTYRLDYEWPSLASAINFIRDHKFKILQPIHTVIVITERHICVRRERKKKHNWMQNMFSTQNEVKNFPTKHPHDGRGNLPEMFHTSAAESQGNVDSRAKIIKWNVKRRLFESVYLKLFLRKDKLLIKSWHMLDKTRGYDWF